jgi:DNA helicase HerA-like ATPase
MQVVGVTTQQEVFVVSRDRKFRINEILVIEDPSLHEPKGEVVETFAYNRLIPMGFDKSMIDSHILHTLQQIGYDIESDEINLARVRLFEEAPHPVRTGCPVRLPSFSEVRHLLVRSTPEEGMVLGEINGTESLAETMSEELRDLVVMLEHGQLRPQKGVPFLFDIRAMHQYPHVGIFGGSGSGKSFGLRVMLEELMKLQIPTIVFDPHFEMDFREKVEGIDGPDFSDRSVIVQIGRDVGISFSDLSTRDITELLTAAGGNLSEAMVNVVQTLHKKKDTYTSFSDRINNLVKAQEEGSARLQKQLETGDLTPHEAERIKDLLNLLKEYGTLPAASVKGIHWRLMRLEHAGLFQQDIRKIEQGLEQRKLVVIQGAAWILQVFATYVIGALYRKRREYKDARMNGEEGTFFPPFIIVTDEAHNFAPKGTDAPTKSILKEIAQEGRKYGVFLFLATQRPTLLDETITAQLNTKFIFRTVRASDIETLKEETDLTQEEGKRLPYLRSGDTFVSSAAYGRTIFIRIRAAYTRSPHVFNPFDELREISQERNEKLLQVLSDYLPIFDTDLLEVVGKVNRACGFSWDVNRLKQELENLVSEGVLKKVSNPLATRYERI